MSKQARRMGETPQKSTREVVRYRTTPVSSDIEKIDKEAELLRKKAAKLVKDAIALQELLKEYTSA